MKGRKNLKDKRPKMDQKERSGARKWYAGGEKWKGNVTEVELTESDDYLNMSWGKRNKKTEITCLRSNITCMFLASPTYDRNDLKCFHTHFSAQ